MIRASSLYRDVVYTALAVVAASFLNACTYTVEQQAEEQRGRGVAEQGLDDLRVVAEVALKDRRDEVDGH